MLTSNRSLHFSIFSLSELHLVRKQVERLWHLSEPYRATYLWLPETRSRIVAEHEEMIQAIADHDHRRLTLMADRHRRASEESVLSLIAHRDAGYEPGADSP